MPTTDTRLGATGQVYVTLRAAEEFAAAARLQIETARLDLTAYLLSATQRGQYDQGGERWRARSHAIGWDIEARVRRQGPFALVTQIRARRYTSALTNAKQRQRGSGSPYAEEG